MVIYLESIHVMNYSGWILGVELTCISGINFWSENSVFKLLFIVVVDILLRALIFMFKRHMVLCLMSYVSFCYQEMLSLDYRLKRGILHSLLLYGRENRYSLEKPPRLYRYCSVAIIKHPDKKQLGGERVYHCLTTSEGQSSSGQEGHGMRLDWQSRTQ